MLRHGDCVCAHAASAVSAPLPAAATAHVVPHTVVALRLAALERITTRLCSSGRMTDFECSSCLMLHAGAIALDMLLVLYAC